MLFTGSLPGWLRPYAPALPVWEEQRVNTLHLGRVVSILSARAGFRLVFKAWGFEMLPAVRSANAAFVSA